jgi:hypothetical protein
VPGAGVEEESTMKRYLISVFEPDGPGPGPEALEKIASDLDQVNQELKEAGSWVFAGGLFPPSTATVLRVRDGETVTTDGPFAEAKEHLGGFTIIRAPDLDAALEWGRRISAASTLPVEVRPFRGDDEG